MPPRMCASELDCGTQAACVAGRCVARGATVAIDTARRLVVAATDVAYVSRSGEPATANAGALGGERDSGSMILVRFEVALPPEAIVLEAYLVLERETDRDSAPDGLVLRTGRIVDDWGSRSISWASQPRVREMGAPLTSVYPSSGPQVRLDVRAILERWRRRSGDDFGIAVAVEGRSRTRVSFALTPAGWVSPASVSDGRGDRPAGATASSGSAPLSMFEPHGASVPSIADPGRELEGPRLELYLR
jgi:hypothetical protein